MDTLALSWYLEPKRVRHGLEWWGEEFGVEKPVIDDWDNLEIGDYIHRCEEDVKINTLLWERQWKQLLKLYGSEEEAWKLIDYLSFKLSCAREQEESGWKLDTGRCLRASESLSNERSNKVDSLALVMPKVEVRDVRKPPLKPFKKDGSMSVQGAKWQEFLAKNNLPVDHKEEVEYIKHYNPHKIGRASCRERV